MKKIIFFLLIFALTLGIMPVLAATSTSDSSLPQTSQEVTQIANEALATTDIVADITTADLDNVNTGWWSGLWRNVKIWVTRDPVKKADLELAKADVELLKVKKLSQEKLSDSKLQARLDKANKNYAGLMEKIKNRVVQAQVANSANPELNKFLSKFTDHQFKHQQILERLEDQVPEDVASKIEAQREKHLEKFGEIMNQLQNKEELKAKIHNSLIDNNVDIQQRIRRVKYIEELEEKNPELKDQIEEVKAEAADIWETMKTKHEAIIKNHEELKDSIKEQLKNVDQDELLNDPEARQELINSIRTEAQEVRTANTEIRTEAQKEMDDFREEQELLRQKTKAQIKSTIKNRLQKKDEENENEDEEDE